MDKKILLVLYLYLFLFVGIFQWYGRGTFIEDFYLEIALDRLDTRVCDILRNTPTLYGTERAMRCIAFIARNIPDASLCDTISGEYQEMCYRDLARITKDRHLCDKPNFIYKENKGYCYADVAVARQDSTICEELPNDLKKICFEGFNLARGEFNGY